MSASDLPGRGDGPRLPDEESENLFFLDDADYYHLLALPREPPPTDSQIRSAYRTLSLSFHPDKQPADKRDAATKHFDRISQAYETLIDPQKRVVYDMVGEEGLKLEWGPGGLLGREREPKNRQIGVQAMNAEQFREWFLTMMKRRELELLDRLVQSRSSVSVKVDARNLVLQMLGVPTDPEESLAEFSSLGVGLSFKTPFTPLKWIRGCFSRLHREEKENNDDDDDVLEGENAIPSPNDALLEIHANVGGKLVFTEHEVEFIDPVTKEKETKQVAGPRALLAKNFSLGATLRHRVHIPPRDTSGASSILSPFSGDFAIEIGSALLPSPTLHATISKGLQLIRGTKPFDITVNGTLSDLSLRTGPTINTSISKTIGFRGLAYCNWSTGQLFWPSLVSEFFASLTSNYGPFAVPNHPSKFEIGYVALPVKRVSNQASESYADAENSDFLLDDTIEGNVAEPLETWGILLHSSPFSAQVSLNYSRTIFGGQPENAPRSEWNYEGYHPQGILNGSRGVRLEVVTSVGLDLSVGWMVSGSRQVGTFTRMGLGVGLQGGKGLVCSVTWQRLGQSIKIPIMLCPVDFLDNDIAVLATMLPWIGYSIVEFGFLRPRERRRQKRVLARAEKRVESLIGKQKADALEATELMREQVKRRQEREMERDGLVIIEARYGYFPPQQSESHTNEQHRKEAIVTIPVAALVDQGQLAILAQVNKSRILGFWDPSPGKPKTLKIRYSFGGYEHYAEFNQSEAVLLPMRLHQL
ncbi:hypothetical protein LOZ53_000076 [Ophidiomyces ophidiicola]|nr:hypothetical protein LOZ55_000146 [Ophidiomyces ophidiicola]KAI1995796.1 hypothetical protein LOZ54_000475 [Ophidiomyces ophidiicola]KAI1998291.1 hypothetical protein LOZ53_000076 [Ophidiomyces ophidiicola]KAI2000858.1 hypothetical protein LOZ51_001144 [Ophidiomyces ophidiicola]